MPIYCPSCKGENLRGTPAAERGLAGLSRTPEGPMAPRAAIAVACSDCGHAWTRSPGPYTPALVDPDRETSHPGAFGTPTRRERVRVFYPGYTPLPLTPGWCPNAERRSPRGDYRTDGLGTTGLKGGTPSPLTTLTPADGDSWQVWQGEHYGADGEPIAHPLQGDRAAARTPRTQTLDWAHPHTPGERVYVTLPAGLDGATGVIRFGVLAGKRGRQVRPAPTRRVMAANTWPTRTRAPRADAGRVLAYAAPLVTLSPDGTRYTLGPWSTARGASTLTGVLTAAGKVTRRTPSAAVVSTLTRRDGRVAGVLATQGERTRPARVAAARVSAATRVSRAAAAMTAAVATAREGVSAAAQ